LHQLAAAVTEVQPDFAKLLDVPQVPAECRLICQLAAGADQLFARAALLAGYKLQVPLPVELAKYKESVSANRGMDSDPVAQLIALRESSDSCLELDGDVVDGNVSESSFAHSALTMLDHSDLLILIIRRNAPYHRGGTMWLLQESITRRVPVIIIPFEKEELITLNWADSRQQLDLSLPGWAVELVQQLLLPPPGTEAMKPSRGLVKIYRNAFPASGQDWPLKYLIAATTNEECLKSNIEDNFKPAWLWTEHRANAYQSLYRGAYLSIAFLGLTAVAGAIAGAMNEAWSAPGKIIEVFAIFLLLVLWFFARRGRWRQRWLNFRLGEQQIRHSAILGAVGSSAPLHNDPAHLRFRLEGAWLEWYCRALIRQANLPSVTLDSQTLASARKLILRGQLDAQIDYYDRSSKIHEHADHRLESIAAAALIITLISAIAYLVLKSIHSCHLDAAASLAKFFGLFNPPLAATMAAIRAQGEHPQLAARYSGMMAHLMTIRTELIRDTSAKSWRLSGYSQRAAQAMIAEVSQWRSLLSTNEIERG